MSKFSKSQIDDEHEPKSRLCHMPDCPLVGTMSHNVRGGGPWWCGYHFHQNDPRSFTPEEKRELRDIADDYNNGKRNYVAGSLESRTEMQMRTLGFKPEKNDE